MTDPESAPAGTESAPAGTESAPAGTESAPAGTAPANEAERPPRLFIERLGLAAVALFVGGLFTLMAGAAWVGEEGFLAVMAGLGGVMTFWAGFSTLRRG